MGDFILHDVPEETIEAITARAERRGTTAEAVVLELMQTAASEERLRKQLDDAARMIDRVVGPAAGAEPAAPQRKRRYRRVEPTSRFP